MDSCSGRGIRILNMMTLLNFVERGSAMTGMAYRFTRPVVFAVAAGLLSMSSTAALSNQANCQRLEDLARQYAGVALTSQQKQLKRRLVAWYNANCYRMQRAALRR